MTPTPTSPATPTEDVLLTVSASNRAALTVDMLDVNLTLNTTTPAITSSVSGKASLTVEVVEGF